jgi:hypothetical protein
MKRASSLVLLAVAAVLAVLAIRRNDRPETESWVPVEPS